MALIFLTGGGLAGFFSAMRSQRSSGFGPFPMPAVWALVNPNNDASHAIFARWGFALISAERGGYDVRYRPSGIGLNASHEPTSSAPI